MSFKTLITVAAFAATVNIFAEVPFEAIETVDGSVYMGHTSRQEFDSRNPKTIFASDSAIRVFPAYDVVSISSETVSLKDMSSPAWIKWFAAHPKYVQEDIYGNPSVVLYNVRTRNGKPLGMMFLMEKSPAHYKFYSVDNTRDTIADYDIKNITYAVRQPDDKCGIVDAITTVDGDVFRGEIISQTSRYTGLLGPDGTVNLIPNMDIAQKSIEPYNTQQPLIEQVRFIDRIDVGHSITGLIKKRVRRPEGNQKPHYVVYNPDTDTEQIIEMSKVRSLRRITNERYSPHNTEPEIGDNEIMADGILIYPVSFTRYNDKKSGYEGMMIQEDVIPTNIILKNGQLFTLVTRDNYINNDLRIVQIQPMQINGSGYISNGYCFNESDLEYRSRQPLETQQLTNGDIKRMFSLTDGTYLIFRNADQTAYLINIERN